MPIKLAILLLGLLLFVADGCDSKSGGAPPATPPTPSPSSAPPASAAVNKPASESGGAPLKEAEAKPAPDACALLEKSEVAAVQGQQVTDAKPSSRDDGQFLSSQCFYVAAAFDRSVSLEVTERSPKNSDQDALKNFWASRFEGAKATKKKDLPVPVAGVGDKAFWVGNDKLGALYALKKDKLVRVSVGGPGGASEKIEKSKKLAEQVLRRLS